MQKIYTTENKVLIYLMKSALEEQGIRCLIKNDQPPLAGEIPPIVAWPELWIMDDDQLIEAKKILQDESMNEKTQKTWTCSHCQEESSNEFNLCWKCGNSRTSA